MKIKEIYVEATFTKNLGNYQSFKPTAGITLIPEDGESYREIYKKGWDIVGEQLEEQLKLFNEEQKHGVKKGL
ncbi:hypothetical protein E308F_30760 [Moorella sp. E308F]|uniref:hypothetical protein n=1 Tax=Moorella sp. E308F TaxID=2572682 RepID=UPI0010FFBD79|nr:hypothetical protein [Moorella sp. E308F]GEA16830.1 hypothetical protein E308F_30760 [Moorella sp. E308F]